MYESAVSFRTPEMKRATKQWVKKGQPGPRSEMHAARTRRMVLIFFYAKEVIYTNYIPQGKTVIAE
jgi:hypothetical protein